jgi:hypothetical protein
MATHRVFCSACDRDVTLVFRAPGTLLTLSRPTAPGEDVECLDQGVTCTGALCSFGAVKPLEPPAPRARA